MEHTNNFNSLKDALCNSPILFYPRYDKPFIIRTDASYLGINGILLQLLEDKVEYPIFYISCSLPKSEYNYPITELEGTAAYYCVNKFKSYILGNPYQTILYIRSSTISFLLYKKKNINQIYVNILAGVIYSVNNR